MATLGMEAYELAVKAIRNKTLGGDAVKRAMDAVYGCPKFVGCNGLLPGAADGLQHAIMRETATDAEYDAWIDAMDAMCE